MEVDPRTFEGETPLFIAVKHNSMESVKGLLKAKAMVNVGNNEDVTPLHLGTQPTLFIHFFFIIDLLFLVVADETV